MRRGPVTLAAMSALRPVAAAAGRILRTVLKVVGLVALVGGCSGDDDGQVVSHVDAGEVRQIAVGGSRVYASDETTITIYDYSDPANPRELGRLESPGYFGAMVATGTTLYVEAGILFKGLETEPDSLDQQWIERGWLELDESSYSQGVFVGVSHLLAFDLADPTEPQLLGLLNITPDDTLAAKVERMFLDGSTLYATPQFRGALIVDVANPRKPKLLGSVDRGLRVALVGSRLYVADGSGVIVSDNDGSEELPGGFAVVDVADPRKPRELGRLDALSLGDDEYGANVEAVAASGDTVYLGLSVLKGLAVSEYLSVVDVSDPTRPRQVERMKIKKGISDLEVVGDTLYALAEGTVQRFDLADPARPAALDASSRDEILRAVATEFGVFVGSYEGLDLLRFGAPR